MIGIITGDIAGSRKTTHPENWMHPLKKFFGQLGNQPATWDIFRGDTFQLEIQNPLDSLKVALRIKALVKSTSGLNTRMAIGVGEKEYKAERITESNGQAFVFSGETYETLKKEGRTLAVRSPWKDFDRILNVSLRLATILTDSWSKTTAGYVNLRMENPDLTQVKLSELLGVSQSAISARHTRSHRDEIMQLEQLYRELLNQKINK